jgi:hypothetical protein
MRKLIAILFVLTWAGVRVDAHSAAAANIVAAGRKSLLIVDAGDSRCALVDVATGALEPVSVPFVIESSFVYDDAVAAFRAVGRVPHSREVAICSIRDGDGALTSLQTDAVRVEAFGKAGTGRLFVISRDDHDRKYVSEINGGRIAAVPNSYQHSQPESDVALDGAEVVSSSAGTVLFNGAVIPLDLPVSARGDRLWHELRLTNGWLLVDRMNGDVRWSREGKLWQKRPSIGGEIHSAVMPYSIEATSDGGGALVVSTIGDVNNGRRLLSRIDANGFPTSITEFGKELGSLVAGPGTMWLVGDASDDQTIRFAAVTESGIGRIRSVPWPRAR